MTTQPPLRLLIPRPEAQAKAFSAEINGAMPGRWAIDIAPLFAIRRTDAAIDLADTDALIFTSRNGVHAFAAATPDRSLPAYCVGQRTSIAAKDEGLAAQNLGSDIAELATALSERAPLRLLHVRGRHTTGDLAGLLGPHGHLLREVEAYDQPPCPLPTSVLSALASGEYDAVTLFSPRTAILLAAQVETTGLSPRLTLFCLSVAVASAARAYHPGPLSVCETPDAQAMLTALQAFARI